MMFNFNKIKELKAQLSEYERCHTLLKEKNKTLVDINNAFVLASFSLVNISHIKNGQRLYRVKDGIVYERWVWNRNNRWALMFGDNDKNFETTSLGWVNTPEQVLSYCNEHGYFFSIFNLVK